MHQSSRNEKVYEEEKEESSSECNELAIYVIGQGGIFVFNLQGFALNTSSIGDRIV